MKNLTDSLNVGDIYYTSWGWEQTNIDWYKIVSKTPKRIKIQQLKSKTVSGCDMTGLSTPSDETMDRIVTAVVTESGIHFNDSGYRQNLYRWDGRPKNFSSYA